MRFFDRHASVTGYAVITLYMALLDGLTGIHFSFWALYLIPIGLATWNLGVKKGWAFAALAVVLLLFTAYFWGHPFSSPLYLAWSYVSRAIAYGLVVCLVGALRKKEIERVYTPPGVRQ